MRRVPLVAIVVSVALLGGCGGGDTGTDERARGSAPTIALADVPEPVADVVLHLGGPAGEVELDRAGIEAIATESITIHEPFERRDRTFTVTPLADLAAVVGADDDAWLHLHALDDYTIELPLRDLTRSTAYLATADGDGADIALAEGGPIRVVFTENSPIGSNGDLWIWSVDSIRVG